MGKNIVVCCDGTGNEYGTRNTNVVGVFAALDKRHPDQQIAFYDPGVGTMSSPKAQTALNKGLSTALGLAFGLGMTRNIEDAYLYLMRNYQPDDRIFFFGFSRGAYTVRALTGLLHKCGLLMPGSDNLIPYAVKLFRRHPQSDTEWEVVRGFKKNFSRECKPHFIGLWDTVKTVGWFRRRVVLDFTAHNPDMKYGRHAVSIDEKRSQYRTNLWNYPNSDEVQEAWFAGVHSDVGGSYQERGLSDIALKWMLEGAIQRGLLVDGDPFASIHPDPLIKMHNPLVPFWWMLGWKKRCIRRHPGVPGAEVWIHDSVRARMQHFGKGYQPRLPAAHRFVS